MNAAVINSIQEKHSFDSKIKEENDSETSLVERNEAVEQNVSKDDPPALHVLSEPSLKSPTCQNTTNVKSTPRVLPLVYIQAPGNQKQSPQILVSKLKSNTTMSPMVLTQTSPVNKSQPIILQKTSNSPNTQTLIPVTVATSTGTKQTFAYLGTIIKPPGAKTSENQIVVPTSHLPAGLVPAPTNQKLVLTSMTMPKLTPRVPILPVSLNTQLKNSANTQQLINFKISNGQIQSDPKGCISVLCDNKLTQELQNEKDNSSDSPNLDSDQKNPSEKLDKVYELSIPDVPTSKCELRYTISIPDEKTNIYKPFLTRTVSTDNKESSDDLGNVQSIVPKQEMHQVQRKSLHEVSILKKCNLNAIDRKMEQFQRKQQLQKEPEKDSEQDKLLETRKVNPERRRKSQYTYLRDFDEVVVTSGNAWENKNTEKLKQFQTAEITFTKLPPDDETKENNIKKMDDFIEIELVKQDLPQFGSEDDQDIRTVLKWRDGIGFLPGSKLKFHINEFGIIEMIVEDEINKKMIKKEDLQNGDEILCCIECGCHGVPSEFVSSDYCSKTCKLNGLKTESKRAYLQDKAKRKKKKLAMLQKQKMDELKVEEQPNSDEDNSNDLQDKSQNYPWQTMKKGFSWSKYLEHIKAKAAPVKLFKDPYPYTKNGFRPGMKLEGIDPQHPSYFCVMSVSEVQGYRIRLHFDGYPENYDFWVNADSMDIFPIGWCEKYNHILHPPPNYKPNEFNWTNYLKNSKATAAPRQLFAHRSGNSVCPNGFRLGMKLEAVDKKNTSLICVATVTDLMDNRFLVHFDSWDDIYDYWADPTSPYIHPVGWCDQFGHNLTPPNDYPNPDSFTWEKYLKETKSTAAPVRAFKQRPSNGFKKEMRLECVDKRVPSLIRVATVEDVREHQIKVRFDGWPNKYSYWIDDDSPDIHPTGWCQKTGHPIESPLTPDDVYENFGCPTVGCRGAGHVQGPKYTSHNTSKDCPYSDENLDVDYVLNDRLNLLEQEFVQKVVVPVSREPKDKLKANRMGRPTKIRRLTETSIKLEWPPEDELSDSSTRKRKIFAQDLKISSSTEFPQTITTTATTGAAAITSTSTSTTTNCSPSLSVSSSSTATATATATTSAVVATTSVCPSQQVLVKHSKILNELITNSGGSATQDPRNWTLDQVAEFVASMPSCREHSKLFLNHKIDGEAFLMLTQRDLVDILKFKLGPAIKLYNCIVLLRQNVNFYN